MMSSKRFYESPVLRAEEFRLGVYGSYGDIDTEPFLPVPSTDPNGIMPGLD